MDRYAAYQASSNNDILVFMNQFSSLLDAGDGPSAKDKIKGIANFAIGCVRQWGQDYSQSLNAGLATLGLEPLKNKTVLVATELARWVKTAITPNPYLLIRNQCTSVACDVARTLLAPTWGEGIITTTLYMGSNLFGMASVSAS